MDVITIGETMAAFVPRQRGLLRYNNTYDIRIAGAESNLAIGLSKLGHDAGWFSSVGNDEFGHFIINQIRSEGVDTSRVMIDSQHHTGIMFKEIHPGKDTSVYYYRSDSAASYISAEQLPWDYIEQADIIHLTGITPILSESLKKAVFCILERMDGRNMISFDPNIRKKLWGSNDYSKLLREIGDRCSVLMLGLEEAKVIYGTDKPDVLADELYKNNRLQFLAIKDGGNGADVYDGRKHYHIPPFKCSPEDMIGAGDAFNAAFLAGILEGKDLYTCGKMGGIAGTMATEVSGDTEGYPFREQMEYCLNGIPGEVFR
ncbi:MAG: sugar kinase [Clostridia bacterium]|nr:sugar kinase [Clostridia bacterium]